MTPRCDEGKEFVKWLKEWRSEIQSHVSLAPIHPEKREDENESGPGRFRFQDGNIIPEPGMAIKR